MVRLFGLGARFKDRDKRIGISFLKAHSGNLRAASQSVSRFGGCGVLWRFPGVPVLRQMLTHVVH